MLSAIPACLPLVLEGGRHNRHCNACCARYAVLCPCLPMWHAGKEPAATAAATSQPRMSSSTKCCWHARTPRCPEPRTPATLILPLILHHVPFRCPCCCQPAPCHGMLCPVVSPPLTSGCPALLRHILLSPAQPAAKKCEALPQPLAHAPLCQPCAAICPCSPISTCWLVPPLDHPQATSIFTRPWPWPCP